MFRKRTNRNVVVAVMSTLVGLRQKRACTASKLFDADCSVHTDHGRCITLKLKVQHNTELQSGQYKNVCIPYGSCEKKQRAAGKRLARLAVPKLEKLNSEDGLRGLQPCPAPEQALNVMREHQSLCAGSRRWLKEREGREVSLLSHSNCYLIKHNLPVRLRVHPL